MGTHYDLNAIKARLPLPEFVVQHLGVLELKGHDNDRWAPCPFHPEKSASFHVRLNQGGWFGHCFGCGAGGDVLKLWMLHKGYGRTREDFAKAIEDLARLAGVIGEDVVKPKRRKPEPPPVKRDLPAERPLLPVMRPLSEEKQRMVAVLRGLSLPAVHQAVKEGILWGNMVGVPFGKDAPMDGPGGTKRWILCGEEMMCYWRTGRLRIPPVPAWFIGQPGGLVCQARQLNGQMWIHQREGKGLKAWTVGKPSWPVGADLIGARERVVFVEGGPDMLAAWHLLLAEFGVEKASTEYAVVGMLGGTQPIMIEARAHFRGKRVRIFPHADPARVQEKGGKVKEVRAGFDDAFKWQEQLMKCDVEAVDVWSLDGLTKPNGEPVNDLNDLALCSPETVQECWGMFDF